MVAAVDAEAETEGTDVGDGDKEDMFVYPAVWGTPSISCSDVIVCRPPDCAAVAAGLSFFFFLGLDALALALAVAAVAAVAAEVGAPGKVESGRVGTAVEGAIVGACGIVDGALVGA